MRTGDCNLFIAAFCNLKAISPSSLFTFSFCAWNPFSPNFQHKILNILWFSMTSSVFTSFYNLWWAAVGGSGHSTAAICFCSLGWAEGSNRVFLASAVTLPVVGLRRVAIFATVLHHYLICCNPLVLLSSDFSWPAAPILSPCPGNVAEGSRDGWQQRAQVWEVHPGRGIPLLVTALEGGKCR